MGQWVYQNNLFEERVIPVRIFTDETTMLKIVDFSFSHYRQIAIMYYVISNDCVVLENPNFKTKTN